MKEQSICSVCSHYVNNNQNKLILYFSNRLDQNSCQFDLSILLFPADPE